MRSLCFCIWAWINLWRLVSTQNKTLHPEQTQNTLTIAIDNSNKRSGKRQFGRPSQFWGQKILLRVNNSWQKVTAPVFSHTSRTCAKESDYSCALKKSNSWFNRRVDTQPVCPQDALLYHVLFMVSYARQLRVLRCGEFKMRKETSHKTKNEKVLKDWSNRNSTEWISVEFAFKLLCWRKREPYAV